MPDHTLTRNNVRVPVQPKCIYSHVEVSKAILVEGHAHAGLISHVCTLPGKHEESCVCSCGFHWAGYTL